MHKLHNVPKELEKYLNKIKKITCPNCPDQRDWSCSSFAKIPAAPKENGRIQDVEWILPALPIICKGCGYISFHAIGDLGWEGGGK